MTLSKEFSRPAEARPGFFPSNPSFSERKDNILPTKEAGVKARIRELSQMFFAESKKRKERQFNRKWKLIKKMVLNPL